MTIRVGIAGYGRSGFGIHTRWLREVPQDFRIVAVADQLPERRAEAAEEWGCPVYDDYRSLLAGSRDELDLVVVALPSDLHVPGAIAALEAGIPTVCEKPLGRSVAEFDRMTAAARSAGVPLLPFQNSRFAPYFQQIQAVLASGVLGEVLHVRLDWSGFARRWDWQTLQERCGGNLLNTGPHPMDHAICLLAGAEPQVCCQMRAIQPFGGDAEDYCNVTLYGPDQPTVEVVLSSYAAFPSGERCNIHATHGGLTATADEVRWKYFDPERAPHHELRPGWSDQRGYCSEELPWVEESWTAPDGDAFQANSAAFYRDVHAVLTAGAQQAIQWDEVRRQIAVIEECHRQNPLPRRAAAAVGEA